jgi:hypothetical protein
VASFSGITHTLCAEHARNYLGLVESEGQDPLALWGDPDRDVVVWRQHNPYHLAERLKGRRVFLSCGNGSPGSLDPTRTGSDDIEESLYAENEAFAERLKEVGVDAQIRLYGDGTHNWPYWQRELGIAWPMLTRALACLGRWSDRAGSHLEADRAANRPLLNSENAVDNGPGVGGDDPLASTAPRPWGDPEHPVPAVSRSS